MNTYDLNFAVDFYVGVFDCSEIENKVKQQ